MKRIVTFTLLAAILLPLCTGCDWIRASLGKPTSKDLAVIRTQLAEREQALRDSLRAVQAERKRAKAVADSLASASDTLGAAALPAAGRIAEAAAAAAPAVASAAAPVAAPAAAAGQTSAPLKKHYAVAGAFREASGVQTFAQKLRDNGLKVKLLEFKSGLTAVCVEGSDSMDDVRRDVETLRQLPFVTSDPWIYHTNQKLHKEI